MQPQTTFSLARGSTRNLPERDLQRCHVLRAITSAQRQETRLVPQGSVQEFDCLSQLSPLLGRGSGAPAAVAMQEGAGIKSWADETMAAIELEHHCS